MTDWNVERKVKVRWGLSENAFREQAVGLTLRLADFFLIIGGEC